MRFAENISDYFKMEDVAYIFSNKTDFTYVMNYYKKYGRNIFAAECGRGNTFLKFYAYILEHDKMLSMALEGNGLFHYIVPNSLNFKNFISMLYLTLQRERINLTLFNMLCQKYLSKIEISEIDTEEKVVIESLLEWNKENAEY